MIKSLLLLLTASLAAAQNENACNPALRPLNMTFPGSALTSPGWDGVNNYTANLHCEWLLIAPEGQVAQISMTAFYLEESTDCSKDWVSVSDYDTGATLYTLCGDRTGELANLPGVANTLVTFHSDGDIQDLGFQGRFDSDVGGACGAGLRSNATTGTFTSPGIPYENDQDCVWTIIAPSDAYRIDLSFNSFSLEAGCDTSASIYDSLTLSDNGGILAVMTGTNAPQTPLATLSNNEGQFLRCRFESDQSIRAAGFNITWNTVLR